MNYFCAKRKYVRDLNHPNIVQVHEVIEEPTGPVIVMNIQTDGALSQAITRSEGRFSKRLYLHAITQLLAGLHYFHELRDYDRTTPSTQSIGTYRLRM